jgi:hypothetical protein
MSYLQVPPVTPPGLALRSSYLLPAASTSGQPPFHRLDLGDQLSVGFLHAPHPVRASRQFRVTVDTNAYSVPAEYAGAAMTLKLYPDHLCLYHQDRLIARHVRCYDRRRDFELPDHPKALLQQRRRARDQKLLQRLLSMTPKAEGFYHGLTERRLNVLHHVRQIVALAEIYGPEKTARAIDDALEFQAFSSEYIANLLEQRQRMLPEPTALHLTRRQDLLELELPEPNLALYEMHENSTLTSGEIHGPQQDDQCNAG